MAQESHPTYWDYLRLGDLLALQNGLEADDAEVAPDELHFIVVHQVYELWFKLVLRELRLGRDSLAAPRVAEETVPQVVHHLRRVNEILKLGADQFRVMETLTPQDFLGFRDKLVPSSGFQSFQMREIEIVLGLDETQRIRVGGMDPLDHIRKVAAHSPTGELAWGRLEAARRETTLRAALQDWLHRTPIQASSPADRDDAHTVEEFLRQYLAAHARLSREQTQHLVRSGAGERTSTARAWMKLRFTRRTRARTRSPGRAFSTKTTRPSRRPTPWPSWAKRSTSTRTSSPRRSDIGRA